MNLVMEKEKDEIKSAKKAAKIILVIILLLTILVISLLVYISTLKEKELKVYLDNSLSEDLESLLYFDESGEVYVPVRAMAELLEYSTYSGDYLEKSENINECYIESEDEVVNFTVNSNKIYKLIFEKNTESYDYYYLEENVKYINNNLYISANDIKTVYNAYFSYDEEQNRVYVYSLDYYINIYTTKALEYGYTELAPEYVNKIALVNNILIAKSDSYYGALDLTTGETILESKYQSIEYLIDYNEFLVKSSSLYGIMTVDKETKVSINYSEILLIDKDARII